MYIYTVEPVYNGHPWDFEKWPLNTGGHLMQIGQKCPTGEAIWACPKFYQHLIQEKNKTMDKQTRAVVFQTICILNER